MSADFEFLIVNLKMNMQSALLLITMLELGPTQAPPTTSWHVTLLMLWVTL